MKNLGSKSFFLILFTFLLSACLSALDEGSTPTPMSTPVPLPTFTPQPLTDCVALDAIPTPEVDEDSLFPPVSDEDRVLGEDSATVTFTVYCDLQSDGCATLLESVILLHDEEPDDVRIVYRDYPQLQNPGHELSGLAAQAVHAARLQDGDWELQSVLLTDQAVWGSLTEFEFEQWVADQASTLGMDGAQLVVDMRSDVLATLPEETFRNGLEIGIPATPFLLFNGQIYYTLMDLASLRQVTQLTLLGERQYGSCPPKVIDLSKEYLAYLETEHGEVVIQFYPKQAPVAVNNFVFLAQEGWFDGITFHRVIPGFVAQTGDPTGTGQGTPGYFFANEIDDTLTFDKAGVVGMANLGENTNGSQFFITYDAVPSLNGQYTIFGQIISGMEVLEQLAPRDQQFAGEALPSGDRLLSVRIEQR